MIIRQAEQGDAEAVFAIRLAVRENRLTEAQLAARGITRSAYRRWLADGTGVWVADHDDTVVGFAIALPKEATIWALFVHPDFEGQGIGRSLLEVAENWLFARGCEEIWLTTDGDMRNRAHGFYERMGWYLTGDDEHGQVSYVKSGPVDYWA